MGPNVLHKDKPDKLEPHYTDISSLYRIMQSFICFFLLYSLLARDFNSEAERLPGIANTDVSSMDLPGMVVLHLQHNESIIHGGPN